MQGAWGRKVKYTHFSNGHGSPQFVTLKFPESLTWRKPLVWAVDTPISEEWFFLSSPWPVNQLHVAFVRGPLIPRQIRSSCLWTMIDRTGPSESIYLSCCVTPQLLLTLCLGLWPSESGMSEIVARGEAENFGDSLKRESSKSEVRNPTLFYTAGYPPKQGIFVIHTCNISKPWTFW